MGQKVFSHFSRFLAINLKCKELPSIDFKPINLILMFSNPQALMYVSSTRGSWSGVSGAMRWEFTNQNKQNGYFYMGFYDLNCERYEMYVGLDSEKKSAYDGAYEKETTNLCQSRPYPEFGLQVICCMPSKKEEWKALGIEDPCADIKAKSFMIYTIKDLQQ